LLGFALAWAEVLDADAIFIGVNAVDYSGYPDCRPEFIAAYGRVIELATKRTVEGAAITLEAPLIELSKAEIIQRGAALGVDFSMTVTCYQADDRGQACGHCDACRLRAEGFAAAGIADCTRYSC
jgi:7-cyano-7-deazaguanine synthase